MVTINNTVMDDRVMDDLYNQTADGVEVILKNRYKMTAANAKEAVSTSPLKNIFEKHGDIAAHTSCESLARDIYEYWERNHHND